MAKVINVSNRLPVTIGEKIEKSSGGLVTALEAMGPSLRWIGWPGAAIDDEARQRDIEKTLRDQFGYVPVFLDAGEVEAFYEGFANSSLWPLLHYMPSRFRYEPQWWEQYRKVNEKFAACVLEVAQDDDLVWVHDYQLMLLPGILREARPSLRVAFFLHTPFPSYEVFRCHPNRAALASGLLGADLVGFHTFGYLRHFCSSVLRLLGIESDLTEIRHEGRTTRVGVYPIGINASRFDAALDSPQCAAHLTSFREAYKGQRVILSVERLDYTKGIPQRLDAIDLFLARRENRDDIKFIFVAVPSRENVEEYRVLREEVELRIGGLNGKYATLHNSPIHFVHGSVDFKELCALYVLADVGLVTPLIDGMNLVAKEYVACQRDQAGTLILSEFAGAAQDLFNATIVNPYDAQSVAGAMEEALGTSPEEAMRLMRPMRERVMRYDASRWASWLLDDLRAIKPPAPPDADLAEQASRRISQTLARGGRVAMFLDYDGTLREIERIPEAARPNAATRSLLDRLQNHPGLDVTIISGRTPDDLDSFLGSYSFGLVAEHGAAIRRPHERRWEQLDRNVSYAWMENVLPVLQLYERSTPGSFIERKRTSLAWHYRRTDPQFGLWKARALVAEIATLIANLPLKVRHGKKIVEITSTEVNKGSAMLHVLEQLEVDLVLCAGDDVTDEDMYQSDVRNLISIHIGMEDTRAMMSLPSPAAFRFFLTESLAPTPAPLAVGGK
ncbi:MAG TPA: bifunctional alpha,alpha-trehalose-phosphate synthase (UDP-forming)/trehalose-phosphatase [Tepidisphaeraceae bacterium]|nr:bifunctional alpha,alpha-trehalose-phosphate synthase (UDP-forming)/trehalose-phosphatase [Tepidisphaeraceae bacterium]